jgi:hypothetical protein
MTNESITVSPSLTKTVDPTSAETRKTNEFGSAKYVTLSRFDMPVS